MTYHNLGNAIVMYLVVTWSGYENEFLQSQKKKPDFEKDSLFKYVSI